MNQDVPFKETLNDYEAASAQGKPFVFGVDGAFLAAFRNGKVNLLPDHPRPKISIIDADEVEILGHLMIRHAERMRGK